MIYIKYAAADTRLQLRGHAQYAPEGQDIVCAGVSALFCTLAMQPLVQQQTEGDWRMLEPEQGAHELLRPMFLLILRGFEALAQQYPEHVRVIVT